MMGTSHALTGTLAFAVSTLAIDIHNPMQVALGAALATGGALLPDIDHPNSTVTKTYGPLTRLLSWFSKHALGGHRMGTHSVPGIAVLGVALYASWLYIELWPARVFLVFVMSLALSAAIRLLHIDGWIDDFLPIPVSITLVLLVPASLNVVGPAIALGCLAHMLGDMLTPSGCPVFWPLSKRKFRFNLFVTNTWPERYVVVPLTVAGIIAVTGWQIASGLGLT